MLDPKTVAWLDQDDSLVADNIRRYGLHITMVNGGLCACCGDDPADQLESGPINFAYTTGLFGLGHPELLIFSVNQATAMGVLNDLGGRIRRGANLCHGELVTFPDWPHRIVCEQVPNPGDIVFGANRHYQRPRWTSVPVLQLTYDDLCGRFPWDAKYANPPEIQPRPGKFKA
jgi:hypothetical protein